MKRRTTGRHRAPLNLPRPLTGTASVAASGLLAATLGAATAVPAPPATAFGVTSTDLVPILNGAPSVAVVTEPVGDQPAQAVPAPAPEDVQHTHFGELGFTGVTPEPEPVEAPYEPAVPTAESHSDTSASTAQSRGEGTVSSRSQSRQESPAETFAPVAPAGGQGAETAIAWAEAHLGLPYGWGSSSGGAYDCSGFTTAAFRAAGISIPHQSEAQYHATSRVSLSEIQRGDLLFYSNNGAPSGIFHVAIYLGNGQVIHSLRDWSSWDGSKVSGLHYASGLMAAGRP